MLNRADEAFDCLGESWVVELVRRVAGQVIVWVAEWRGVGDHEGGIPFLPECSVVRPAALGKQGGREDCAFDWKRTVGLEIFFHRRAERLRIGIGDDGQKVAHLGVERGDQRRVFLTRGSVGVVAHQFLN